MKKFLIIGGCGYVGTHLYEYFHKKYPNVHVFIWDIANGMHHAKYSEKDLFSNYYDAVFYLAADSMVSDGIMSPFSTLNNNVGSLLNYINELKGKCKTFVFASSSSVYRDGLMPESGYSEDCELKLVDINPLVAPNQNIYAISKIMGERILKAAYHETGMKSISLRFGNIAGVSGNPNQFRNHLIPKLIFHDDKQEFVFNGNPIMFERDYVHIHDVCVALDNAWQISLQEGSIIDAVNIGSGVSTSNKTVHSMVEKYMGKKIPYRIGPERIGDSNTIKLDIKRAEDVLSWKPKKTLDEIIESYVGVI